MSFKNCLAVFVCFAVVFSLSSASFSKPINKRPVLLGTLGPETDVCNNTAWVVGLKKKGDGFLAVRAFPGVKYRITDKLLYKQLVYLCEVSKDEKWYGIIYSKGDYDGNFDCELGSSLTTPKPYNGPCASGWVSKKFIEIIAG